MSIEDILGVEPEISKEEKKNNAKNASFFKEEKAQAEKKAGFKLFAELEKNAHIAVNDGDAGVGTNASKKAAERKNEKPEPAPDTAAPAKRGRGRPPGSTSKKNKESQDKAQGSHGPTHSLFESGGTSNNDRAYIDKAFHSLEENNRAANPTWEEKGKYNKRGALKKDVKWATETLMNQRRNLSKEEQQKIQIANTLNDLQLKFPHIETRMGSAKNRKDISKTSLHDLQEELRHFKEQLSKPFQETIIEETFLGLVKVFENVYMNNVYNTKNDFLKVNIRGLHDTLRGRKAELSPELKELTCLYGPYLQIGPGSRLIAKTMKIANDVYVNNTSPDYAEVNEKYAHL